MPTPIRESVIAAVMTRVAAIGTSGSYITTSAPFTSRNAHDAAAVPWHPAAYLASKGESYERVGSHGAGGVYAVTFRFQIIYWTRNWTTDVEASNIIADMLFAMKDWTLGSTCDDSGCESTLTFTSEDDPTLGGVVFNWYSKFRLDDQTPTTRV